jgi:hypothetical protein
MDVIPKTDQIEKYQKIEEIVFLKRNTRIKENNCFNLEDNYLNKTLPLIKSYSNVIIGSVITHNVRYLKANARKKKKVTFKRDFVEYVYVDSYKNLNKINCYEPIVDIVTSESSCKQECKILDLKCLIF